MLSAGRRWGKTALGLELATGVILDAEPVGWFAPSYKLLTDAWRELRTMLQPIITNQNVQERRLEFLTGGSIDMWSLDNPDAGRGRKYARIVIDEAAMVRDLAHTFHASLRPTLTDLVGDAWFLSTPKGRNGFWQFWQLGQDTEQPEWASWQAPTEDNPWISLDEIGDAQRQLPERIFAQEYLAQFLEDAGGVFRNVVACATATEQQQAAEGHDYVIGVDWGKHNDFTVLAVVDTTTRELCHLDRFNQIDYTVQRGRLHALCERFRPGAIIAERNAMGEPIIEQLQREGLPVQSFQTTNASKAQAVEALALAFERNEIGILPDSVLVGELQAFEGNRLPSGMVRYEAPAGMHDDTVMALALAWQTIAQQAWLL